MTKLEESFCEEKPKKRVGLKRRVYKDIDHETRLNLIKMVTQDKVKISEAAITLKINLSTAKFIVSSWRKTGKVMKKKSDDLKEIIEEEKRKLQEQLKKQFQIQLQNYQSVWNFYQNYHQNYQGYFYGYYPC